MVRWESERWTAHHKGRSVGAEFCLCKGEGQVCVSFQWRAFLWDLGGFNAHYYYPNITTLKRELTPWLEGGELPS